MEWYCRAVPKAVAVAQALDVVLTDVKAYKNGLGGLYVGKNAYIQRCNAYQNGFLSSGTENPPADDGIMCGAYSTVVDCKSRGNRGAGFHTYNHTRLTGCTATESATAISNITIA